jgi:hypothetical protein
VNWTVSGRTSSSAASRKPSGAITPAGEGLPVAVTAAEAAASAITHKVGFRMILSSLLNAQEGNAHVLSKLQA